MTMTLAIGERGGGKRNVPDWEREESDGDGDVLTISV